jgi:hypothetical protein
MFDPNTYDSALTHASAPTHSMWITNATQGELIATGGCSRVYIGLSPPAKQLLAVKIVAWTSSDERAESTESLIPTIMDVLKDITHPNVVQCLGYACPTIGHLHLLCPFLFSCVDSLIRCMQVYGIRARREHWDLHSFSWAAQ